ALGATPSRSPPAPGRTRALTRTVPAGTGVRTGPVSGPATNAPWPCRQIRSLQPSGRTRTPGSGSAGRAGGGGGATGRPAPGPARAVAPTPGIRPRSPPLQDATGDGRFVQDGGDSGAVK